MYSSEIPLLVHKERERARIFYCIHVHGEKKSPFKSHSTGEIDVLEECILKTICM